MKKYFLLASFCIAALAGNAQIVSSTSRNITTTTVEKPKPEKKTYFGIDASVGKMSDGEGGLGAFGLGLHWERHYNPYVAWDIVSFAWDAPFDSPGDLSRLSIKTGVRAFSPRFFRDMRAYANLDLGYTTTTCKYYYGWYEDDWEREWYHGFGLEFGFGLRLTNHVGVGYALNWDSESEIKGNYFRVSVLF